MLLKKSYLSVDLTEHDCSNLYSFTDLGNSNYGDKLLFSHMPSWNWKTINNFVFTQVDFVYAGFNFWK